jgi:phage nucleotide-binding protein
VAVSEKQRTMRERVGAQTPAQVVKHFNFLVYGDPGTGKTTLLSTAQEHPDTSPVLLIDVEGGTATVRHKEIDVVSVRSVDQLMEIYNELRKDPGHYKTIGIDSLTELQKLDMNDIMVDLIKRRPDLDPDVPSQREWGKSIQHTRNIVRRFRDLPYHVVFTALAKTEVDSDGTREILPNFPGKLAGEIPGFLDVVGWLNVVEEKGVFERRLQVQPTRRVKAKDRLGIGGPTLVNPTISMIWENIKLSNTNSKG